MRRLLLAALVAAIGLTSTASADSWTPPPTTDEGMEAAYLPIAQAAWPDSPCAGREVVHLHATDFVTSYGELVGGFAVPAWCEVWLRDSLDPVRFCAALTHELGHLATGVQHTEAGVMRDHEPEYPPCSAAILPPASDKMGSVKWVIWNVLPTWLRPQAQIICGKRHCIVRGPGMRTRRYAADPVEGTASGPAYPRPSIRTPPSTPTASGS